MILDFTNINRWVLSFIKRIMLLTLMLSALPSCAVNISNPIVTIQEATPDFYTCNITNKNGDVILSETIYRLEPTYKYVSDTVVEVRIGIGTALTRSIFYDTETDVLSCWIYDTIASDGFVVAYVAETPAGELAIVIQDVFSDEIVATIFRDFSPVANPGGIIISADLLGENALKVTYLTGTEYEQKHEIIRY